MPSETALAAVRDAARYPDLDVVRQTLIDWRFYHDLRDRSGLSDPSPMPRDRHADAGVGWQRPRRGVRHAGLSCGRTPPISTMPSRMLFPARSSVVPPPEQTASFGMRFAEFPHRVFDAAELSDGTLRYLALMGALLGYRPPAFIALNEPEASLHPDLLTPLARLIVARRGAHPGLACHALRGTGFRSGRRRRDYAAHRNEKRWRHDDRQRPCGRG